MIPAQKMTKKAANSFTSFLSWSYHRRTLCVAILGNFVHSQKSKLPTCVGQLSFFLLPKQLRNVIITSYFFCLAFSSFFDDVCIFVKSGTYLILGMHSLVLHILDARKLAIFHKTLVTM